MLVADVVSYRSTCIKRRVGCVIAVDREIVSTGYNGAPKGYPHCIDIYEECPRKLIGAHRGERYDLCPALHAEQNAIIQSAKTSKSLLGGTAYITIAPCINCARMLVNAGIDRIVMGDKPTEDVETFLNKVSIIWEVIEDKYEVNINGT